MPVVLEPDSGLRHRLLSTLPPGAHAADSVGALGSWLEHRDNEYVVLL